MDFRSYMENQVSSGVGLARTSGKRELPKKEDILRLWQSLSAGTPVYMKPLPKTPPGVSTKTFGQDGVRISGSWQFIVSVLSKLKELTAWEGESTRLRLQLKEVAPERTDRRDTSVFVLYINVESRDAASRT